MKKFKVILLALLSFIMAVCVMTACTEGEKRVKELGDVTEFKYDFNTGEYSFKGVDGAVFYLINVIPKDSVNVAATSGKIIAAEGNAYSGTVADSVAPGDYVATVTAYAPAAKPTSTTQSGKCTSLMAPTVTAYWATEGDKVNGIDITLAAGQGDEYAKTFNVSVKKGETTVYSNATAQAGDLNLSLSDLTGVSALTKEDKVSVSASANKQGEYSASKATVVDVTEKRAGGPGGFGGGGGGFGGAAMELGAGPQFAKGAAEVTVAVSAMGSTINLKGALTADTTYVYALTGSGPMGEAITGTLEIKDDNTVGGKVNGFGPFAAITIKGTWAEDGGNIVVTYTK